jgi:NTP pyrophosphatase (non-canonical NTP hydrolase)
MQIDGSRTWRAVFVCLFHLAHLSHPRRIVTGKKVENMNINELTERMHAFVRSKGWYEPDSKRPQTPRNLAVSLSIEAAEILEHFQWHENTKNKEALAGELADVALYLLQLASISGIDLEKAILKKLETNATRQWDQDNLNLENRKPTDL